MLNLVNKWVLLVLLISFLFSLRTPRKGTQREEIETHPVFSVFLQTQEGNSLGPNPGLEYDHYRDSCPEAEKIVRSIMSRLYAKQKDVPAALLRLFFHDCFIRVYWCFLLLLFLILASLLPSLKWVLSIFFTSFALVCLFIR